MACWRIFRCNICVFEYRQEKFAWWMFSKNRSPYCFVTGFYCSYWRKSDLATKEQILQTPDRLAVLNTTIERALQQLSYCNRSSGKCHGSKYPSTPSRSRLAPDTCRPSFTRKSFSGHKQHKKGSKPRIAGTLALGIKIWRIVEATCALYL